MSRAIGFGLVIALIGGAVWVGLASGARTPDSVEDVHDLGRLLASKRFGCGAVDISLPGLPRVDASVGVCELWGRDLATLYVFETDSQARGFQRRYEMGTDIGWVVGENWVVAVDGAEVAEEIAETFEVVALTDPLFHDIGADDGVGLRCPPGDVHQETAADFPIGARGFIGDPRDAAREALSGLRPTDELKRVGRDILVVREGNVVAIASLTPTDAGGWLVGSSTTCASSRISHG